MTDVNRWLLPAGIEEVLPQVAARLERLRRRLLDMYESWGYELVMPPFIEYLESLLTGTGNDLDLQTFKLTDQLTGRMMGVRADMTPQVARIDAHSLNRECPVRLCYLGTVLHTRPDGFASSRSPLQVGAELYGHAGMQSDLEVLMLMLATLQLTGLRDVHLDLGHVGIFRGLARQARLDDAQEAALFNAMQRKASAEIDDILGKVAPPAGLKRMLAALPGLHGGVQALKDAVRVLKQAPTGVLRALESLSAVAEAVQRRAPGVTLHFDLAELRGYHYHTGLVFAAFVPGHGAAVAQGGRYDEIGKVFGRARPATGFSADLKTLVALGEPAAADTPARGGIYAPAGDDTDLDGEIQRLREAGERVVRALPGQKGGAREMDCDRVLKRVRGQWRVTPVGG